MKRYGINYGGAWGTPIPTEQIDGKWVEYAEVERLNSEINEILNGIQNRILVREGGGLENNIASLAVSVAKCVEENSRLRAEVERLREALEKFFYE